MLRRRTAFSNLFLQRVIGGQQRDLTEIDRRCLQQILGFDIPPATFTTIAKQLRSQGPEELDRKEVLQL
jgi:hypothetical protein